MRTKKETSEDEVQSIRECQRKIPADSFVMARGNGDSLYNPLVRGVSEVAP
jgi:hypothetical protein